MSTLFSRDFRTELHGRERKYDAHVGRTAPVINFREVKSNTIIKI